MNALRILSLTICFSGLLGFCPTSKSLEIDKLVSISDNFKASHTKFEDSHEFLIADSSVKNSILNYRGKLYVRCVNDITFEDEVIAPYALLDEKEFPLCSEATHKWAENEEFAQASMNEPFLVKEEWFMKGKDKDFADLVFSKEMDRLNIGVNTVVKQINFCLQEKSSRGKNDEVEVWDFELLIKFNQLIPADFNAEKSSSDRQDAFYQFKDLLFQFYELVFKGYTFDCENGSCMTKSRGKNIFISHFAKNGNVDRSIKDLLAFFFRSLKLTEQVQASISSSYQDFISENLKKSLEENNLAHQKKQEAKPSQILETFFALLEKIFVISIFDSHESTSHLIKLAYLTNDSSKSADRENEIIEFAKELGLKKEKQADEGESRKLKMSHLSGKSLDDEQAGDEKGRKSKSQFSKGTFGVVGILLIIGFSALVYFTLNRS